jgi:acyl-CoA synthetase (AMP-forming)/AMP-acid ligase II
MLLLAHVAAAAGGCRCWGPLLPQVLEAAVIALPDERWGERPLLIVVPQPAAAAAAAEAGEELSDLDCCHMALQLAAMALRCPPENNDMA